MLQLMTRHDAEVGVGIFDSIKWLFETALNEVDMGQKDNGILSAIVYGCEDSPDKIEFYSRKSPLVTDTPTRVWYSFMRRSVRDWESRRMCRELWEHHMEDLISGK